MGGRNGQACEQSGIKRELAAAQERHKVDALEKRARHLQASTYCVNCLLPIPLDRIKNCLRLKKAPRFCKPGCQKEFDRQRRQAIKDGRITITTGLYRSNVLEWREEHHRQRSFAFNGSTYSEIEPSTFYYDVDKDSPRASHEADGVRLTLAAVAWCWRDDKRRFSAFHLPKKRVLQWRFEEGELSPNDSVEPKVDERTVSDRYIIESAMPTQIDSADSALLTRIATADGRLAQCTARSAIIRVEGQSSSQRLGPVPIRPPVRPARERVS